MKYTWNALNIINDDSNNITADHIHEAEAN